VKLTVGTLLGLVATATSLWTPLVVERVINLLGKGSSVMGPITELGVLTVIGIAAMLAQWLLLGRLAETVVYGARALLVHRFFRGRVHDVMARPAGELVSRATSDTLLLREATSSSFVVIINGAVGVIGTIILMGVIDPLLLGLTIGAIVLFGGIMAAIMPQVGVAQARAQDALGRMGGELEGSIRALRTVKAAGAEQRQSDAVLAEAKAVRSHSVTALKAESIAWTTAMGGMQVATVAIIALGAWRVSAGYLSVAALVAFLMYVFNFPGPMMDLATAFSQLQTGMAAARRIRETDASNSKKPPTPRPGPTRCSTILPRCRYWSSATSLRPTSRTARPRCAACRCRSPAGAMWRSSGRPGRAKPPCSPSPYASWSHGQAKSCWTEPPMTI
jgi:ATP-binding cassette subfamily B protein